MVKAYAFAGNETVGAAVAKRLDAAGYTKTSDYGSATAVITFFTSSTALEDAYFDEEGIIQSVRPGTLLLDLSASTPSFAREINAVSLVNDLVSAEAPLVVVDPTEDKAFEDAANLLCFVSGEEDSVKKAIPFVEAIAGAYEVTGSCGSAQLARAAYTIQSVSQIIAAIEADALYRAVQRSSVSFVQSADRVGATTPQAESVLAAVSAARYEGDYTVEMLMSEVSSALMAADDVDLILPQTEACLHLLELLAVVGGADKAPSSLALVYGDEASCAAQGLDWTRAEQAYGSDHDHDHDHDHESDYDDDDYGYDDDYSDDGFGGGFGSYSAN